MTSQVPIVPGSSANPATDGGLRFLVIDDDPVHRMVIKKVGEKAGYTVTTASTVEESAKAIEQQTFHAISLDLSLGSENGNLVLGHVAKHNQGALLIIISGAADGVRHETLDVANRLRLNVVDVPKPVDLATLRVKLTAQVGVVAA